MGSVRLQADKMDKLGCGRISGSQYLFQQDTAAETTLKSFYSALRLYGQIECRQRGNSEGGGIAVLVKNR